MLLVLISFSHASALFVSGFFRIELGKNILGIEHRIVWAVPGQYTDGGNIPCSEDGKSCGGVPQHPLASDPYSDDQPEDGEFGQPQIEKKNLRP